MTKQGKINLLGLVFLPAAAVLGAALATMNGAFNAYGATYAFVFMMNCVITIPAVLLSGLFLRWSGGEKSRWIAIAPMLVPVAIGSVWYIWRGLIWRVCNGVGISRAGINGAVNVHVIRWVSI